MEYLRGISKEQIAKKPNEIEYKSLELPTDQTKQGDILR